MDRQKSDHVLLGVILSAHGIRGDVLVKSFADVAADISAYGPLMSADPERQFELRVVRETNKGLIVHIKDVDDRTAAEALKGTKLFVPRERLPDPEPDAFYHADLIGLRAVDASGNTLGTVTSVQNYGANDILELARDGSGETDLIPFTKAHVPDVSLNDGTVTIILPTTTEARGPDEET